MDYRGTPISPILQHTRVSKNINKITLIKDTRHSFRRLNHKPTRKLHAILHRHLTRSFVPSLQLMEQMTRMKSRVDEIQDFVNTNVRLTTEKKGKQVTFIDQLPSQATANPRNQGALSSQMHNINHVHVDKEAEETTLAISSLRSGKALPDPYKDHSIH